MYNKTQPPLMTTQKTGGKSPHCKVCGDESSGFHYGVDSCEGCKGFFRRCITQGMTHKCANEEKCEITPFTRNSCQYCRLKKCFSVGMSREASRLGRRPKRLKDVSGDSSRSHQVNLPIAPYPSPAELYRLRMAELQKLLQANGTFKSELMQAFLSAAQASFREHAKNNTTSSTATSTTNTTLSPHTALQQDNNQNTFQPGMVQFGNESGYSSMSSPASSKSQSPLHDVQQQQQLQQQQQQQQQMLNNNNQMMDNTNMNLLPAQSTTSTTTNYNANLIQQQQLQQQHQQQHLQPMTSTQMANTSHIINNTQMSNTQLANTQLTNTQMANTQLSNTSIDTQMANLQMSPTSSMSTNTMAMPYILPQDGQVTIKTEPALQGACDIPDSNDNGNSCAVEYLRLLEEAQQTPSETRRQLVEQVMEVVVTAHMNTCLNTRDNVAKALEKINNSPNPMPMPDMSKLAMCAGSMWKEFVAQMVPEITRVVSFCKKLPGFSEIEQEDQIKLIKQGSFEVMMARFTMLIDPDSGEMLDPSHKMKCPRQVILSMPMGNFFEEFFKVAGVINPLCLTDGEIGMFTACLIICPERTGLKNVRAISKIQSLFHQALYILMTKNHPDPDTLFLSLQSSIPILRAINEEHSKAINNIKMMQSNYEDVFPALHREVFDGKI